jgi:serine/threonine protein kinase
VLIDPAVSGELAPEFLAQGYDAVLIEEGPEPRSQQRLRDLAERPGFAPLAVIVPELDAAAQARVLKAGATVVLSKLRMPHEDVVSALGVAASRQKQARAEWRASAAGRAAREFGGASIPGYRRIRTLASGPTAELHLAESEKAGLLVALKVARDRHDEHELDDSFRRFLQEYEIVESIRHPAIVRLYDLGVSDEHAFLVMEYFRAGDLRRRIKAGIGPTDALRYASEIGRALGAVHAAGVLHRDLKPGNIMLRDDGSVALIDFGLAKQEALALDITDNGLIFGTPHYMSPEQGHGEPVDQRSDLYSLGVMLFEMLAGEKPFTADNPMAIIYQHRRAPIPALPPAVDFCQPIVEKLLAKKPEDRFLTASAVCAALEEAHTRLDVPLPAMVG